MSNSTSLGNDTENTATETVVSPKRKRGFAAMSPEKRKEISSRGGKKAAEMGVSHRYSSEEAKENGRKGGSAPHVSRGRGQPVT